MFEARKKRYLIACIKNGETAPKGKLKVYKSLILPALTEALQENDAESALRILELCRDNSSYKITEKQLFAEIRKYFLPDTLPASVPAASKHNFIVQFFINIYQWIFGAPVNHQHIRLALMDHTCQNATLQNQYHLLYMQFVNYYKYDATESLNPYIDAILATGESSAAPNKQNNTTAENSNAEDTQADTDEDSDEDNNNQETHEIQKQFATELRIALTSTNAPPPCVTKTAESETDTEKPSETLSKKTVVNTKQRQTSQKSTTQKSKSVIKKKTGS